MTLDEALISLGTAASAYETLLATLRANPRYENRFWGTGSHRRPMVHAELYRRVGDVGIRIEDRGDTYWVCLGRWHEDGTAEVVGVYEYPWTACEGGGTPG